MTFLITLIALVIERFFHWRQFRQWRWFTVYQRWLSHSRANRWSSFLLVLLCVLPPVLLVALINYFLNGVLYGTLKFIFGLLIVLYSLGPQNVWMQIYSGMNELNKESPQNAIDQINASF